MTFGIVMVMAFSGLGCHNVDREVSSATLGYHATAQSETTVYTSAVAPSAQYQHHHHHSAYSGSHSLGDGADDMEFGRRVHSTLYSFVFGHDPDVPTVKEIESSLQSGEYERATMSAYRR